MLESMYPLCLLGSFGQRNDKGTGIRYGLLERPRPKGLPLGIGILYYPLYRPGTSCQKPSLAVRSYI